MTPSRRLATEYLANAVDLTGAFCTIDKGEGIVKAIDLLRTALGSLTSGNPTLIEIGEGLCLSAQWSRDNRAPASHLYQNCIKTPDC